MRKTIAHGKLRYQQKDRPLWGCASTWEMRLTEPIPRPERKDSVVPGWRHQGRRNFPVLLERRSLDAVLSSTSSRPDRMITFRRNHSVVPGWAWSS